MRSPLPATTIYMLLSGHLVMTSCTRCVDIAIVGGGPCGLATAVALKSARPSLHVAVYERDSYPLEPKGASIQISRAGWSAIEAIDPQAAATIRHEMGAPLLGVCVKTLDGQRSLMPWPVKIIGGAVTHLLRLTRRLGMQRGLSRIFLWHDVRQVLADRVSEVCGSECMHFAHTLVSHQSSHGTTDAKLEFEVGGEVVSVHAKLVLACDGVSSAVRALSTSPATAAHREQLLCDEGKSVWRGIAPSVDCHGVATFYRGEAGRSALLFPAGRSKGSAWTIITTSIDGRASTSDEARRRLREAVSQEAVSQEAVSQEAVSQEAVSQEAMAGEAVSQEAMAGELWRAVEASPVIVENKLRVRDYTQPWESGDARVAYLGDAAHPLRPTGEGTALAFEDAWVLGSLARAAISDGDFLTPATLRRYEDMRLARVAAISEAVRAAANAFYREDEDAVSAARGAAGRNRASVSEVMRQYPVELV